MSRMVRWCVVIAFGVLAAAPAAKGAPFNWSPAQAIDDQPPFAEPANLAVSCPSASLCVGIDDLGNVLSSTNPAGGAGTWTAVSIRPSDSTNGFSSIACPSTSLCVAVDGSGHVATSTNPTGGSAAWSTGHVTEGMGFGSVTCPSSTLCLATGGSESDGNLAYSVNPGAGASSWQWVDVGNGASLNALSCASASLCVATEETGGGVYTSTNPTGGSAAWTKTTLAGNPLLAAVACPAATLCVIGSGSGIFTSANPTGGAGAWTAAAIGEVRRLACPSTSLCVGLQSDHVISSTNPTGGAGAWAASSATLSEGPSRGISCPTTALCLVTLGPNVAYSTDPTNAGSGAWTEELVDQDGTTGLASMACSSSSMCLIGDTAGRVLLSTNPTGGPAAWDAIELAVPQPFPVTIKGLACPSTAFCAAVGGNSIYTSTDPTSAASWGEADFSFVANSFTGIACPSATLCVAADSSGKVFTSTNPTGGAGAWQSAMVDPDAEGWSTVGGPTVACPSVSLCLVIGYHSGNVASSTNPTGGARAWSLAALGEGLTAASCPATTFCVVTASYPQYKMWTASNPTGGAPAWSSSNLVAIGPAALSCPTTSFCAAGGFITTEAGYNVAVTTNPAGGGSTWQGSNTNPGFHGDTRGLAVACPSPALCLLGDPQGNLYAGTPSGEEEPGGGGGTPTPPALPAAVSPQTAKPKPKPKPVKCRKGFKKKKVKGKVRCVRKKTKGRR